MSTTASVRCVACRRKQKSSAVPAIFGLVLAALIIMVGPVAEQRPAWGAGLATNEAFAIDLDGVTRTLDRAGDIDRLRAIIVAHDGEIVAERRFDGPPLDQPVNVKSVAKSVIAALVGIAIERGVLEGVDQPVTDVLAPPGGAANGLSRVTVGHLLTMTAGLERTSGSNYGAWTASPDWIDYALSRPFVAEPGQQMQYSTGTWHVLSAMLTEATGRSTLDLARDWLGDPLNIRIPPWPRDPQGIYFGGNDMLLSPRALVRFGELYRMDGVIDGQRVLPEGWVAASWTPRSRSPFSGDDYGYGWFVTRLAGETVYYGRGYGGQMLYVVPDRGLTVVMTANPNPPSPGGSFVRQLHRLMADGFIPAAGAAGG